MSREKIQSLITDVNPETITSFFRDKTPNYAGRQTGLSDFDGDRFSNFLKCGEIKFDDGEKLVVVSAKVDGELSERSCRLTQYDKAKRILKSLDVYTAGIFIFCDADNNFRFSLVYEQAVGRKRLFNNFRRFTFYANPTLANKTFIKQIESGDFNSLQGIKNAFSVSAVTDEFYNNFSPIFEQLAESVVDRQGKKLKDSVTAHDFALLFVIRTIFIGFIQKRKWIGDSENFLRKFWDEYPNKYSGKNKFYAEWLEPLFFEALALGPQMKFFQNTYAFSDETRKKLRAAPFLNGGLFKQKKNIDEFGHHLGDKSIKDFFDFLFAYNFTIEENTLYDQELELNPEFLGIIFERLINKENGAVYTPRPEVDLMCRLSLVKWLEKNTEPKLNAKDIYELFFREIGTGKAFDEDQKQGSFSDREKKTILSALESITICDPAVGSGAFLVGMLHVLDEIEQSLRESINDKSFQLSGFERKKRLIGVSLYGVEVKEWAVWITQLRLWITLFIDAPDHLKDSIEPILPSLDFRVRCGDSLVQRIGNKSFPVSGHANIKASLKTKITQLKAMKVDFFRNCSKSAWEISARELALFREILGDEIAQKEATLRAIKRTEQTHQADLFNPQAEATSVPEELFEQEIKAIKAEIEELKNQQVSLRDDHPLIWNIEFAEVFGDKGGFDIIIGNPPYIRQEDIGDPKGKNDNKQYKSFLQDMVRQDFPAAFPQKEPIDAKSDLYTYFYIRSLRLLNPTGIHTFICSNSWLDVGYGKWFQKFLLKKVPIHFIIDNHAKRSFSAADVNTIISIMGAPQKTVVSEHFPKFVAFKKPFEDAIFTENLLEIEAAKSILSNETFRVFPIANEQLSEAGTEYADGEKKLLGGGTYIGNKWGGKYLRAPDIYWAILQKAKDKLVPVNSIAEVRRGFTTGANEFFYLDDATRENWKIEKDFLKPAIVSPRECSSVIVKKTKTKYLAFVCHKDKAELKGTQALAYIKWGESQDFNKRPSCANRARWYEFQERDWGLVLWPMIHNDRQNVFWNPDKVIVDHNMFEVFGYDNDMLWGSLSWSGQVLFRELHGRANLGEGALKTEGIDIRTLYIFNSTDKKIVQGVQRARNSFSKRDIGSVAQESKENDRRELDEIFFDVLDLTKGEREAVYEAAIRLVESRLSKAASV